jgi:transcriptional regulator with XRE-family HTH domain
MTQEQFADALGVDRATVSQWENGRTMPRLKNIAKIEEVLKIRYFDDVIMPKQ